MVQCFANTTTRFLYVIVSRAGQTGGPPLPHGGKIYVSSKSYYIVYAILKTRLVWYTSWRNRGYLSKESILKMPVVEDRWRQLSEELPKWKEQGFDVKKK